ncbi:Uncharacterised protein [Klebsiella pneumoniae]|nr:Uncharacterised protein [Klebsiella pneumoniae]
MRRGVAGLGGAGDVAGLLGDAVHVGAGGTAVHRSDVASAEAFDEAPEGLEQRAAIVQVRRADDHRLAAALLQPGQGRLVAHALGQADGVADGGFVVGVRQVATTTQRRAESRAVDGDNGLESRGRILGEVETLEPGRVHHVEHAGAPLLAACCPGRAVAARHLQYRQASAKRPQGRRPGGSARRAGYWTKLRRTVTTLGSARSKPAPACSERPVRSDPGAPGGKPWTRVKPASIVSPRNRQRCSRRPCGSPRSTSRRIRPPTPCASSTNSSGRSAPAWTTAPRPASAPRGCCGE